jgi:hypothetical protein
MTKIETDDDLQTLYAQARGYIYNDYSGTAPRGARGNVLHIAKCPYVARSNTNYGKYFFANYDDAAAWLGKNRGRETLAWRRCHCCPSSSTLALLDQSMRRYNHKNCQSLFGYAADVHIRSGGKCQLCGCGGSPLDFDLWRQMTVEHLIGKSQGGYLKQIRTAVEMRFPHLSSDACENLSLRIDTLNTVTACSFCNSTTSRDVSKKSMPELLREATGTIEEVEAYITAELQHVLERKRLDVQWKLASVKEAFQREVYAAINGRANPAVQGTLRDKAAQLP